jgi:hypothetical protein
MKLRFIATTAKIFLYYPTKHPEIVLASGFDLQKEKTFLANSYCVHAFSSVAALRKYHRSPFVRIIKFIFDGNFEDPWKAEDLVKPFHPRTPEAYAEIVLDGGIDAVVHGPGGLKGDREFDVFKLSCISNIELVPSEPIRGKIINPLSGLEEGQEVVILTEEGKYYMIQPPAGVRMNKPIKMPKVNVTLL